MPPDPSCVHWARRDRPTMPVSLPPRDATGWWNQPSSLITIADATSTRWRVCVHTPRTKRTAPKVLSDAAMQPAGTAITPRYAPSHQRHDQIYWVWRSQACRRCVLSPVGPYCLLTGLTGCKGTWLLRQKKMTSIFPTRPGTAASLLLLLQPCIPAATVGGHFVQPRQGRGASGRAPANQPGAASRRGRRRFSRRVLEASIGPWCVSHQPRGDCFCSALGGASSSFWAVMHAPRCG